MMKGSLQKPSVLYVDDEKSNLTAFKYQFRKDFEIHLAESAKEAYDIMQNHKIQVLIADQRMPVETGVELLERTVDEFPNVIRMILTGYSDIEAVIDAINKGKAYHYMKKPWNPDQLKMVIGNALEAVELEKAKNSLLRELEQKNSELTESREKYRRLIEGLKDDYFFYFHEKDGVFSYVSPSVSSILGYAPDEFRTHYSEYLTDSPINHEIAARTERSLRGEEQPPYEMEIFHKNGSIHTLQIKEVPITDIQGEVIGIEGIAYDMTAHKQAQMALQRSEKNLAEAQGIAHLGSWELDIASGEWSWSDEIYNIFEIDPAELTPSYEATLEFVHPDDREKMDTVFKGLTESEEEFSIEHRLLLQGDKLKYVRGRGKAIYDEQSRSLRAMGTLQDVTEQTILEQEFMQAQKMEAIGTLVGGIAHDFNNILAGILGNAYLLQGEVSTEKGKHRLDQIEDLGMHASEMIKQLLAYARKGSVRMKPLPFVQFMKEAFKMNRITIPANIRVTLDFQKNDRSVMGDATQLQQLLMNLLNNARDAVEGRDNPEISVIVEPVDLDGDLSHGPFMVPKGSYMHLSVADNGCGIPQTQLRNVFDPFFTTKAEGKGTGLGLAMVHGAVLSHHGQLSVESREGEGTVFHIYLPAEPAAHASMPAGKDVIPGQGETILLVDDENQIRQTIGDILQGLGYHVITAGNGQEGVEQFQAHRREIDLILSDIVMPVMDGEKMVRIIRTLDPSVGVIFMTGYDSGPALGKRSYYEAFDVVDKPVSVGALSSLIRETLQNGSST